MSWDPTRYLRFSDERLRPGLDLLARIPDLHPRLVVDLGCGPGNLTVIAAARWPEARLVGLDSSPAMLAAARASGAAADWVRGDIADWDPPDVYDLMFSNAALHWIDDHDALFPRLAGKVAPRGVLAVQMPDNWREPTHRIPAAILDGPDFDDSNRRALLRDRVESPAAYRAWIGPDFDIDIWTTTYHHVLTGTDPVVAWITGSVLKPVLDTLEGTSRDRFLEACASELGRAYPTEPDGTTILRFRRLFIVARRR